MRRETAQGLKAILNTRQQRETIMAYAQDRIDALKDQLVLAATWDETRAIQGAIRETQRLFTLPEEVKGHEYNG